MFQTLGWMDQLVFLTMVLASIGIGLYWSRKNRSLEAYLLGERNLPWWAILGSIVATETSTATVLSVPGYGYGAVGLSFLQLAMGLMLGRILVAVFFLPAYFSGQLTSAYQVLGRRFGTPTCRVASSIFLVARNLGDGLRLYLAALVMQALLGWSVAACCLVVGLVTIVYTFYGGMRSIVWNDCFQWCVYMLGGVVSLWVLIQLLPDGWSGLYRFGQEQDKWRIFRFGSGHEYSFWGGLLGGAVLSLATHGTDQMMVQRYLSARSRGDATKAVLCSGLVVFVQFTLFLLIGVALAAYYSQAAAGPQPPEKADQVFAHFIIHVFPANTGMVGLLLAAIVAATLSTLSSSLNSSASAVLNDFLLPRPTAAGVAASGDTARWLPLTRWLTVAFGGLQISIGILAQWTVASVIDNSLRIAGFAGGLILGLFVLGVATRRVGQTSALVGCGVGLAGLLLVELVGHARGQSLAVPWVALLGATGTIVAGYLASFFLPGPQPGQASSSD